MSMKTIRASERTKTNRDNKTPRRNSSGRTTSNLKTTRNGRVIIKGSGICEERNTQRMERRIPRLAKVATIQAYRRALASGNRVLIAEGGQLKEVSPDGKKRIIRQIEPSVKMQKGQIIKIK